MFKRKFGKKSYSSRKRFKRRIYRKSRRSLVKTIRNVALRNTETKYTERGGENLQLYHNGGTGSSFGQLYNLMSTFQGDNVNQRAGNEVFAVGMSIKLWLSNKLDRPNVMYRIIIFTAPVVPTISVTDMFDTSGGGNNHMISYVNTEKYKVVYNRIVQPFSGDFSLESGSANKEHSRLVKIWLPFKNSRVPYHNASDQPKYDKHNLHLAIVAYDAYGTLEMDNIASFSINARFYFKDP